MSTPAARLTPAPPYSFGTHQFASPACANAFDCGIGISGSPSK
jgi:hypothetical protein